jgi:hypothetical protein
MSEIYVYSNVLHHILPLLALEHAYITVEQGYLVTYRQEHVKYAQIFAQLVYLKILVSLALLIYIYLLEHV